MSVWSRLGRLLTVDDSIMDEDFSLMAEEKSDHGRVAEQKRTSEKSNREQTEESKPKQRSVGASKSEEDASKRQEEAPKHQEEAVSENNADKNKQQEDKADRQSAEKQPDDGHIPDSEQHKGKAKIIKPKKLKDLKKERSGHSDKEAEPADQAEPAPEVPMVAKKELGKEKDEGSEKRPESDSSKQPPEKLSAKLDDNRATLEKMFHLPKNADLIIRNFIVTHNPPIKAIAVFMEGISDKKIINSHVLEPLMFLASGSVEPNFTDVLKTVKERLLPGNQVTENDQWKDVKTGILSGSTAVFIEGSDKALIVETKGWDNRGVGETTTETVVRGPHDAFTENIRSNTGLVRSRLRSEQLVTEMIEVGKFTTNVAVMYMEGIANPLLVEEVKRRIKAIKVDYLPDSGLLEQFIEDPPFGMIPRMLSTERPDRVAFSLAEGYVAVLVGASPYALIMPAVFFSLIHTAEDAYVRWPFGSFLRLIRHMALVVGTLLPALYISVANYHPEMIPTDLMLAIAAAREKVPFPVPLEVLMMILAIELIQEAGIRIPNVIGPTIGIVGALILGQAAVQAGVISPLLVIIIAVTALASFAVPNYNLLFTVRVLRLLFIFVATLWGFYGVSLLFLLLMMRLVTLKSFGVPMFAPLTPYRRSAPDVILRGRVFEQEKRPVFLRSQDIQRQKHIAQPWNPAVPDSAEAREEKQNERGEPRG